MVWKSDGIGRKSVLDLMGGECSHLFIVKKADTGVLRRIDLAGTYFFATDLNDSAFSFLLSQL